jgi:hypothetical protein
LLNGGHWIKNLLVALAFAAVVTAFPAIVSRRNLTKNPDDYV